MSRPALGRSQIASSIRWRVSAASSSVVAVGDLARVGEPLEELLLLRFGELGGGVKALPQQRERLGAVEQPRVDPRAAQDRVDLLGEPLALDRGLQVRLPQASGRGRRPSVARSCSRLSSITGR